MSLTLDKMVKLLHAEVLTDNYDGNYVINKFCATDLMSDVLANVEDGENLVLITDLNNIQVVRTAEMLDIKVIIFTRDKNVCKEALNLAFDNGIIILKTPLSKFDVCGLLYSYVHCKENGLKAVGCGN